MAETIPIQADTEYGQLQKVLIQPPGRMQHNSIPWDGVHPWLDSLPIEIAESEEEHAAFRKFLESEIGDTNVLTVQGLLRETLEAADGPTRQTIIHEICSPDDAAAERYIGQIAGGDLAKLEKRPADYIVGDVLGEYPRSLELDETDGTEPSIFNPKRTLMFTRDAIATLPIGAMICSMAKPRRQDEPALLSAILRHHPDFGAAAIAIDLPQLERQDRQRYIMEGGNVQLHDHIVTIGMGDPANQYASRTNQAAAEKVTRELFRLDTAGSIEQVVHVYIPDLPINIHLDSVFNMVGPKSAVVMPYIFNYPQSSVSTIGRLRDRIVQDMNRAGENTSPLPQDTDYSRWGTAKVFTRQSLAQAEDFASAGRSTDYLGHLASEGVLDFDKITWVGGSPRPAEPIRHLLDAFREQTSLGANVFMTAPFRGIAYDRNYMTGSKLLRMMRGLVDNAHLEAMPSPELRTSWGGPHCMALPLQRALR